MFKCSKSKVPNDFHVRRETDKCSTIQRNCCRKISILGGEQWKLSPFFLFHAAFTKSALKRNFTRDIVEVNVAALFSKGWVPSAKLKLLAEAPPMRSLHFCCLHFCQTKLNKLCPVRWNISETFMYECYTMDRPVCPRRYQGGLYNSIQRICLVPLT